jgi:hypothetical protein
VWVAFFNRFLLRFARRLQMVTAEGDGDDAAEGVAEGAGEDAVEGSPLLYDAQSIITMTSI